jgi:hypothetical protein
LLAKRKNFPRGVINEMNKVIGTSTEKGLWFIVEELSSHLPELLSADAVTEAW